MRRAYFFHLICCVLTMGNIMLPAALAYEINGSPFATEDAPLPQFIHAINEKKIVVDPAQHVWGAYDTKGRLIRWGLATAGANWCSDSNQSCRTTPGSFRIYSLGSADCISRKYPIPNGGAPMPYCMYFNGSQALHGSHDIEYGNASHGCVRVHVSDAEWLRHHFVEAPSTSNQYRGTLVVIKSY